MDNKYAPKVTKSLVAFRYIALSGMFAAIITLTTSLFHVSIGSTGGYMHFGDAFIYLAASFLPPVYACAAAAVGGGLADLIAGMPIWILPTVIIKIIIVLPFTNKKDTFLCKRNILALISAWAITTCGYYLAEAVIYGNWIAPIYSQLGNLVQCVGSSALYLFLSVALDRFEFKKRITK